MKNDKKNENRNRLRRYRQFRPILNRRERVSALSIDFMFLVVSARQTGGGSKSIHFWYSAR